MIFCSEGVKIGPGALNQKTMGAHMLGAQDQAQFATPYCRVLLNISFPWQIQAQEEIAIISWRECSKKPVQQGRECLLHPAECNHCLTRGAHMEYVSTEKWRDRRWQLFSTFPAVLDQYQHPDFNLNDFSLSLHGTRFTEMVED